MKQSLTVEAGNFASTASYQMLSAKACETVRLGFVDYFAALMAGRNEPVTANLCAYAIDRGGAAQAVFLLSDSKLPAEAAALIDATAAHAHDFDDYAFSNHPSAVLVPAILAAAATNGADGQSIATSYVVGYEIWGNLMRREKGHLHSKGWHPTAVLGPVAAAAAAAHVLQLSEEQSIGAIALAASHAGGLMGNFGTQVKPYHAGHAAESGVRSALLSRLGIFGNDDVLESDTGLLNALSPEGMVDRETPANFGGKFLIDELSLNIKKYPTVGASQRSIDAILELMQRREIDVESVEKIIPRVSVKHRKVMPFDAPVSAAEAKFSLHFACAAALRFGRVTLAELQPAGLNDPLLRSLMGRVEVQLSEDYDPDYPGAARSDQVTIILKDGQTLTTEEISRATGHADRPLGWEALREKFMACAQYGSVDPDIAQTLFDRAQRIDSLSNIADLPTI